MEQLQQFGNKNDNKGQENNQPYVPQGMPQNPQPYVPQGVPQQMNGQPYMPQSMPQNPQPYMPQGVPQQMNGQPYVPQGMPQDQQSQQNNYNAAAQQTFTPDFNPADHNYSSNPYADQQNSFAQGPYTSSPLAHSFRQTTICVASPKGGVGKTTTSKELAYVYAQHKANGVPLKVCLVDCDVEFGDVANMTGLRSTPSLLDWIDAIEARVRQGEKKENLVFHQNEIERYLQTYEGTTLSVLAAPHDHGRAVGITGEDMRVILRNLKTCDFDVIILDAANNTSDYTFAAFEHADSIVLIATSDYTTLFEITQLMNTLKRINFNVNKFKLVYNKIKSTETNLDEFTEFVGFKECLGILPEERAMNNINNSGKPAASMGKETAYTMEMRHIAQMLIPSLDLNVKPTPHGSKPKKGLFSKFFK